MKNTIILFISFSLFSCALGFERNNPDFNISSTSIMVVKWPENMLIGRSSAAEVAVVDTTRKGDVLLRNTTEISYLWIVGDSAKSVSLSSVGSAYARRINAHSVGVDSISISASFPHKETDVSLDTTLEVSVYEPQSSLEASRDLHCSTEAF